MINSWVESVVGEVPILSLAAAPEQGANPATNVLNSTVEGARAVTGRITISRVTWFATNRDVRY